MGAGDKRKINTETLKHMHTDLKTQTHTGKLGKTPSGTYVDQKEFNAK